MESAVGEEEDVPFFTDREALISQLDISPLQLQPEQPPTTPVTVQPSLTPAFRQDQCESSLVKKKRNVYNNKKTTTTFCFTCTIRRKILTPNSPCAGAMH